MFDRVVTLALCYSSFFSRLETEMAEHEAGVPLMDETLNMMLFPDDIVLLSTSPQGLRKNLETLENYCSKWNLQINEAKTKVSMFGTNYYTYQFHFNSLPLEVLEDYKYLGLWISKKKNFKKAIHHVSCQSKKVLFALKLCLIKLQTLPVRVALHLFNSIIKPILCYGCEIWGFTVKEEIERIEVYSTFAQKYY